jgi:hypothetical protein
MAATDQVFFVTVRKLKLSRGKRKVLDLILCKIVKMTTRGLKQPKLRLIQLCLLKKNSSKCEIPRQLSYSKYIAV